MARDWSLERDRNVFLVYQARMTWTAAAFAEYSPGDRDEFAAYARHGIAFLDKVLRDGERGGFHWVLDREGHLDPNEGDEKHVYGTSFVVYAGSKTFLVTGDPAARRVARDAFDWLESPRTTANTEDTSRRYAATANRSWPGKRMTRNRSEQTAWASITASSR